MVLEKPSTVDNMSVFSLSAELQSVGKQLPVASSNDTFYRCHVRPFPSGKAVHFHYSRVSKMWPLLSFISTPLNEQSHSLNFFLVIDFYLFSAPVEYREGSNGFGVLLKSQLRELTHGWLRFHSKQCTVCSPWLIEHYWFKGMEVTIMRSQFRRQLTWAAKTGYLQMTHIHTPRKKFFSPTVYTPW